MPIFSDPRDPPGPERGLRQLFRNGGVMLDVCGWSTVAVGVAQTGSAVFWLALLGGLIGLFQLRAIISTAVAELVLLGLLLTLAPPGRADWVWVGGLLIVIGRAATLAWLRVMEHGAAGEG